MKRNKIYLGATASLLEQAASLQPSRKNTMEYVGTPLLTTIV